MAQTSASNATYVNPANPGNVGTASSSETADFTITGTVSQACVLGAGGDLNDVNFGTIGIYADATSTVENVFTSVGPANGLDHNGVISLDTVVTVPSKLLGRTVGFLTHAQEAELARAVVLAYDLDIPLLG